VVDAGDLTIQEEIESETAVVIENDGMLTAQKGTLSGITIQNGAGTIVASDADNAIEGGALAIADGSTLIKEGDGTLVFNNLGVIGTLNTAIVLKAGTISAQNAGAIPLTGPTVAITGDSTVDVGAPSAAFGVLTINDDVTLGVTGTGDVSFTGLTAIAMNESAIIAADTDVTVGGALTLNEASSFATSGAGEVTITGGAALSGTSATIETSGTLNLGAPAAIAGKTLNVVGGGKINATGLTTGGVTSIDFSNGTTLKTAAFDDTGATLSTVNLTGNGTLAIDAALTGAITAGDTTFHIATDAMLSTVQTPNGPMGTSQTSLVLEGGTFFVTGEDVSVYTANQLDYSFYDNVAHENMRQIDDGIDRNDLNGGLFTLTPTPDANRPVGAAGLEIWTGEVWRESISDTYVEMWSGNFHAPTTSDYTFYVHGDDNEILWMDLDQSGEFNWVDLNSDGILDSGEGDVVTASDIPEGWNTPRTYTVSLEGGEVYPFAMTHSEGGGGDQIYFSLNGDRVNPSDINQAGLWSTGAAVYDAIVMTSTPIEVTADSALEARTNLTASFGDLTLTSGTLTISRAQGGTSFTSLATIGDSAAVGITSATPVTIGSGLTLENNASFTFTGNEINFASAPVLSGTSATIGANGTVNLGGALDITGKTLGVIGTGVVNTTEVKASGATAAINFADGATLATTTFDDLAAGTQVNIGGNGTLLLDSTASETITAAATTFKVGADATLKAMSDFVAAPSGPLGVGGSTINLDGGTAEFSNRQVLTQTLTYDFESGDLTGWTVVPYTGGGTGDLFEGGKQPYSGDGAQGTYTISTYRNEVGGNNDAYTGIIETDSFVIDKAGTITFQIAAGSHLPTGDPDAPNANMAGLTLERQVAPGDWEMIEAATNSGNNWGWDLGSWDTTPYIGQTVRLRIYDTNPGSWGHTAVDDIQVSSADILDFGALNMGATDFVVTQDSNLVATTVLTATFGDLTLDDSTLNITEAQGGTTFASLAAIADTKAAGIISDSAVNIGSALTLGQNSSFTFTGSEINFAGAALSGNAATISTPGAVNLGGAALDIAGKNLSVVGGGDVTTTGLLASGATTVTFADGATLNTPAFTDGASGTNVLTVTGNGTLAIDGSTDQPIIANNTTFVIQTDATVSEIPGSLGASGLNGTILNMNGGAFETIGGIGATLIDGLNHYGYHTGPNGVMDLNNNNTGGMMGGGNPEDGPTYYGHSILTDGPGGRGLDFNNDQDFVDTGSVNPVPETDGDRDNYSSMWLGYLVPDESGAWSFRRNADDDRVGIWLDIDQDGVFESSTAGLGSNRGEQLMWEDGGTKTLVLEAGQEYLIAFTHSEGGGGSQAEFQFQSPSLSMRTIKPSDAAQAGLWQYMGIGIGGAMIDMSATNVIVSEDSDLVATTRLTATFGELKLENGILNVSGAKGGVTFNSINTDMIPHGSTTGIVSNDPLTLTGTLNVGDGVDLRLTSIPTGGIAFTDDAADGVAVTIRTEPNAVLPWAYNYAGDMAVTHAGVGTLQMRELEATNAVNTSFIAQGGVMEFSGDDPLGGSQKALTLSGGKIQITGAEASAPAPAQGNVLANWTFDETSGATAIDASGNGHNGAIVGDILIGQSEVRPGTAGSSYYFDGAGDQVTVPAGIDISNKSFTLAAWVKRDSLGTDYIMGQGPGTNNLKLHFGFRDADNATLAFYADDSDHVDNPQYADTDGWHHLVATYNVADNTRHIYWDGVDQTPLTNNPASGPFLGTGQFDLGVANGQFFQGWLDDMFVYDTALSGAEAEALFGTATINNAIYLPDTDLVVTQNSTLEAVTSLTATFGALSFDESVEEEGAMLTISGAYGSVILESTTVTSAPTGEIGFDTESNTYAGLLDFNSTGATIVKTGAADLILDSSDPSNMIGGEAFDVRAGRLIAQAGTGAVNPLGVGTAVKINGGEVVLLSEAVDAAAAFDNPVTSTGGALTIGDNGTATLTLGNGTDNNLTLDSGMLQVQTNDYTLAIAGDILGGPDGGSMTIGAGSTVTAAKTIDAARVILEENASLSVVGTVNVNELIGKAGTSYVGPSALTVRDTLRLDSNLDMTAATLMVDGADVTISNGLLTVGHNLGATTPVASVNLSNNAGLTLGGNSLITESLMTNAGAFTMGGTGNFIATGNIVADPISGPEQLELTGGTLNIGAAKAFNYESFSGEITDKFTASVAGGDFTPVIADGALRLTDNSGSDNTIAYRTEKVAVAGGFDTTFKFDFHDITGGGADGLNFMVSANAPSGAPGEGGLGSGALNVSLASYNNNLIRIKDGGTTLATYDVGYNLSDAGEHSVRVVYDGSTHLLDFYFDDMVNAAISGLAIDLGAMANGNAIDANGEAYVGFSARTGGSAEYHDVTSLSMNYLADVVMPDTNILMTNSTILDLSSNAVLGDMIVDNSDLAPVTLVVTGADDLQLKLNSTMFTDTLTDVLTLDVTPKVDLGAMMLADADNPIIEKIGSGELIVTKATDVAGITGTATVNVTTGSLTLGDTGVIGSAINMAADTTLKLSRADDNLDEPTYTEAITFAGNSTILAGPAGDSSAAAAEVTLPAIVGDLSGSALTLGATDEMYTLKIASAVNANTLATAGPGTVILDNGGSAVTSLDVSTGTMVINNAPFTAPSIAVTGTGSLTTSAGTAADTLNVEAGAVLNAATDVAVTTTATLGEFVVASNTGNAFGVSGADVAAAHTLTLNGGSMNLTGKPIGGDIPMPIIAGVNNVLWLKADALAQADGTAVATWTDSSGSGNHATDANTAHHATYVLSDAGINNMPALSFDGTNDQYAYPALAAQTVFFVAKADSGANNIDGILGKAGADDGIRRGGDTGWQHPGDGNDFSNPAGSAFYINGTAGSAVGENIWHIAEAYRNGSTMEFDKIGQYYAARDFPGDIAEVIIFDGAVDGANRNKIGGYLAAKYGITSTYSGQLLPTGDAMDLSSTTLATAASSDVTISGEAIVLDAINTANDTILTLNAADAMDITLTNMTLGGGSQVLSSRAATTLEDPDPNVAITVTGTLTGGDGKAQIGHFDDFGYIDLNLTGASAYDVTFIEGVDNSIDVSGLITMETGADINLSIGSGSLAGKTVRLFRSYLDEFSIDGWVAGDDLALADININLPAGWAAEDVQLAWETGESTYDDEKDDYFAYLVLVVAGMQAGDADADQDVDEDDMAILLAQFGSPYDMARIGDNADFNEDGYVDMADFVILRANWGEGTTPPGATDLPGTTPEPTTMSLLAIGALVALRRRRRKA
jgi:hypothetical protein